MDQQEKRVLGCEGMAQTWRQPCGDGGGACALGVEAVLENSHKRVSTVEEKGCKHQSRELPLFT